MAAATTVIMAGAAIAGVGMGAAQMAKGAKKERDAKIATEEAVKELRGMIEEGQANRLKALQIPTMGSELQERSSARATAAGIEAVQEAGAAGVIGGVGRITQAAGEQAAAQAAEIDRMQKERDRLVLTEEQRLESQKYQGLLGLQQMELSGSQQAIADALAQQQAGAQTIASSLGSLTTSMAAAGNPYGSPKSRGALSYKDWSAKQTDAGYQGTRDDYKIYLQNF